MRILLEHQIAYPALTNLLKSVYIQEAVDGFTIPGKPQTISRLSLLTEIHRKNVERLRNQASDDGDVPSHVSLGAQLVLRWTAEPEYRDAAGSPRALPRLAGDRREPNQLPFLIEWETFPLSQDSRDFAHVNQNRISQPRSRIVHSRSRPATTVSKLSATRDRNSAFPTGDSGVTTTTNPSPPGPVSSTPAPTGKKK